MAAAPTAEDILEIPPGVKFCPDDDELVELYLLPRVRGQPAPFHGVIVEDDTAASTLPWKLFERHHRADDDEAYFYVRTSDAKDGARQDRGCAGGGTWVKQKRLDKELSVCGEKIKWSRNNLNLHLGGGKSGSTGWVMHEYTITSAPCLSLKICHVAFTGHGQKRKRVPDDHDDGQGEPAAQRACVATGAADSDSATSVSESTPTTVGQGSGAAHASGEQEPTQRVLTDEEISEMVDDLLSNDLLHFLSPASAVAETCFEEHVQAAAPTTEQQVKHVMQLPTVQESVTAEHPHGEDQDQQVFLTSKHPARQGMLGSLCAVPDIGDMVAGTQLDGVSWGGFHFY
ncbi:NAC domain-containing protein 96-like [Phragmites australis]|uniref:NAC domain-containing protein 96-like n=1 Tax=Phragmites australis TaxID=29695 RepID=UPI002D793D32|nr:NAC domain-containing protein 96-like [Phragmites australis]